MTDWRPAERFPDPAVRVLDERFRDYIVVLAKVERLATGCRWSEGPVWFGDQRCLIWSDIPNDRLLRWDESSGQTTVFRQPARFANGNARDQQGRLLTCEHGERRVVRTEYDGRLTVLAESFDGKTLNSPNDICVASDGAVWFTDPAFGISGDYEGYRADAELPTNIYRVDSTSLEMTCVAGDVRSPNGLAFSPDGSLLYVVQSRALPRRNIIVFDAAGGTLRNQRVVVDAEDGIPDGLCIDEDGNLWCGWGMGTPELDGVRVFDPSGIPLGHIRLPERCANVTFGGRFRNRLFMAAGTALYSLHVNTRGA